MTGIFERNVNFPNQSPARMKYKCHEKPLCTVCEITFQACDNIITEINGDSTYC